MTARMMVALSLVTAGCSQEVEGEVAFFAGPFGMTVAGTNHDLLYVSQSAEDTLQVARLSAGVGVDVLEGPVQYFPLRIPVGGHPTYLAASVDGRYVIVLNQAGRSLSLVDADSQRVVSRGDVPVTLSLAGSQPHHMIEWQQGCVAPCLGRVLLSLPMAGAVMQVDLLDADTTSDAVEAVTFVPGPTFPAGVAPTFLAAHPNGRDVLISDPGQDSVVRLDVTSGVVDAVSVGATPGDLAVTGTGERVLVLRPTLSDLIAIELSGALTVVDANAAYAPRLQCLEPCDVAAGAVCGDAHPADLAICANDEGFAARDPYPGVFLGLVPARILTLGKSKGTPRFEAECTYASEAEPNVLQNVPVLDESGNQIVSYTLLKHDEFALVAGETGEMRFVRLSDDEGQPIPPAVLSGGDCLAVHAVPLTGDDVAADPGQLLGACPELPDDRQQWQCVPVGDGGAGVGVSVGHDADGSWRLRWEGSLAGEEDPEAQLTDDGNLAALNFPGEVAVGDWIEVVTRPLANDACRALLPEGQPQCALERRVTALPGDDIIGLDEPLPQECFAPGRAISYVPRAGGQFVLEHRGSRWGRLAPGQRTGPAGDLGVSLSILLRVTDFDPRLDLEPCARHDAEGAALEPLPNGLSRKVTYGFELREPFAPLTWGLEYVPNEGARTVGTVPGEMLMYPAPDGGAPVVAVSFAGAHRLLLSRPYVYRPRTVSDPDSYSILR